VLLEEFIKPMKLNQGEFAANLEVNVRGLPECEVELSDGGCVTWLKI